MLPELASKAVFMQILVEGRTPSAPATRSNVETWISALKMPYTVARDPDGAAFNARAVLGFKETTYVVERATMKIVLKSRDPVGAAEKIATLP